MVNGGFLTAMASLVIEHEPQNTSSVVAHRFSCSAERGIFLNQRANPCCLHCKTDSELLNHREALQLILKQFRDLNYVDLFICGFCLINLVPVFSFYRSLN